MSIFQERCEYPQAVEDTLTVFECENGREQKKLKGGKEGRGVRTYLWLPFKEKP